MSEKMVSGKLTQGERVALARLVSRLRRLAEALEHGEAGLEGAASTILNCMSGGGSVVWVSPSEAHAVGQLHALITEE